MTLHTPPPPSLGRGLRVVDMSTGIAGAYAARVFAGLGAEVIKVELSSARDPLRTLGADLGGVATGFAACNVGKRSVVLDSGADNDRDLLERMLAASDVLIESADVALREELDLGAAQVQHRHPHLIHASLTPFGDEGPYAGNSADDLVLTALAGWMAVQGEQGREPLATGADTLAYLTGNAAVVALTAALAARDHDGHGQHLDVRTFEVAVAAQIFDTVAYSYTGIERPRRANDPAEPWAVLETKDGHIAAARSAFSAWEELWVPVFGDEVPVWVLDPTVAATGSELRAELSRLVATRTKRELVELCQLLGHIVGEVLTIPEVLSSPQHAARDYFDEVEYPAGRFRQPGPPVRFHETPWRTSADGVLPAPSAGQHSQEIRASEWAPVAPPRGGRRTGPPLQGVRVLDFTMGWAGPYASELLADLGADVVKVESITRTDWWRTARRMFTGGVDDPDWLWEMSPLWNSVNESKRGITLDLRDERCQEIARSLAASADLVIENFTPRVMASFGLTYETIRELNPRAVMVSMPGFGTGGPWGEFRSTALVTEAMAGLGGRCRYADGTPQVLQMSPADPNAGLVAAWASILALREAARSGEGQSVEISQVEAMTHHLSWEVLEYQATGVEPPPRANSSPCAVISGCWPAAGDDQWVVASVADVAALEALTGAGNAGSLAEFIASYDRYEAVERLQRAGIAAAPVQSASEVLGDPHLRATGFFHTTDRPYVGEHRYPSTPFRMSASTIVPRTAAPTLGEHTREVLAEWVGVSDAVVDELEGAGLAGTEPRGTSAGKVVQL